MWRISIVLPFLFTTVVSYAQTPDVFKLEYMLMPKNMLQTEFILDGYFVNLQNSILVSDTGLASSIFSTACNMVTPQVLFFFVFTHYKKIHVATAMRTFYNFVKFKTVPAGRQE